MASKAVEAKKDRADRPLFTPGPWTQRRGTAWDIDIFGHDRPSLALASAHKGGRISEERDANAHLISAAPELLEQTQLLVRCLEYEIRVSEKNGDDEGARLKSFTLAQARAVVAKALGQPA
jgi:hypothetical protein